MDFDYARFAIENHNSGLKQKWAGGEIILDWKRPDNTLSTFNFEVNAFLVWNKCVSSRGFNHTTR